MRYGYLTSSLRFRHVAPLAIEAIRAYPRFLFWTLAVICVELWARVLGLWDALRHREEVVWRTISTSKAVAPPMESVTLISISWPPGALNTLAFLRDLRKESEPSGSVFWWDGDQGEILVAVSDSSPLDLLQQRIEGVTHEHSWPDRIIKPAAVSCRLVQFPASRVNN